MWVIERRAEIDFETYSEAGAIFDDAKQRWHGPLGSEKKRGLPAVGAAAYAEHPSTEVLTLSYMLPDDTAPTRWQPGQPNPQRLFEFMAAGGLIEAHNVMFERLIWFYVCQRLYGWPDLPAAQLRCSMAKARVNCLPGALGHLTEVLPVQVRKNADGRRLLDKFSVPRNPTAKDKRLRIRPHEDPQDGEKLFAYCDDDVRAERGVSDIMMPLSVEELQFWQIDQEINWRGVAIDRDGIRNMIDILGQALEHYGDKFRAITDGLNPSQVQETVRWLAARGVYMDSLDAEAVEDTLKRPMLPQCQEVLRIRQLVGSASVKKLYAMERQANNDDRLRNLIIHHGARTGRPTGEGPQPLNLPKAGPELVWCETCARPSKWPPLFCPWCSVRMSPLLKRYKWGDVPEGVDCNPVDHVQEVMATRSLDAVEELFGDALLAISGSIRGMFQAGPGMDLIASDYSAIEAVVIAVLAGEQWRIDVFHSLEDIYLMSAAKITGKTLEFYKEYKRTTGSHHPDRQMIGKVAELALGFGGWLGGWRGFDDSTNFTDAEVKQNILAWRNASPAIVEFWGGQTRGQPWQPDYRQEMYGVEGAFIQAVQYPGRIFNFRGMAFFMRGDAAIIRLLSGRELTYHNPRLNPSTRREGELAITYMTWNSNPKYGPPGWGPMSTFGGRLTENIVQATAHDILRYAIVNLRATGYPTVLHVYDEIVAEVPHGWGTLDEFETIMATMPPWAQGWPIRASGGWRGKRYRKG